MQLKEMIGQVNLIFKLFEDYLSILLKLQKLRLIQGKQTT